MASSFKRVGAIDPDATTCNLWYIRRELGQLRLSDARMVGYVDALIADHAFPRPYPTPLKGGGICRTAHVRASWNRAAVDAWLAGWIPPEAAATIDAAALAAAATEMDAAATQLRLVGGRDYGRRA